MSGVRFVRPPFAGNFPSAIAAEFAWIPQDRNREIEKSPPLEKLERLAFDYAKKELGGARPERTDTRTAPGVDAETGIRYHPISLGTEEARDAASAG